MSSGGAARYTGGMSETTPKRAATNVRTWIRDLGIAALIVFAVQWWRSSAIANELPVDDVVLADGSRFAVAGPRERPLLIHFEASWCGVCRMEDGSIADLLDEEDHDVLIVASQSGPASAVLDFARQHGWADAHIAVDADGSLAQRFGVSAFPTAVYVDRDGNVSDVEVGYTSSLGMRWRLAWAGR